MTRMQRTINQPVTCTGAGLHNGKAVTMTLKPAPADTGVVFIRTDRGGARIKAVATNAASSGYATTLCCDDVCVESVEHLLSALGGLNIDNVFVELDAEEIPIMDGSARPFVRLIAGAGAQPLDAAQPALKVTQPVFVRDGNKQLAVWPAETPSISYFIDFNHPMLKEQSLHYQPSEDAYVRDIADARTFGFLSADPAPRENDRAPGASPDAAGAPSEQHAEGLRYDDEFVRHKILDLVGDLMLAGMPIIGHVVAHKSGHSLNARMVARLMATPQSWVVVGSPGDPQSRQEDAPQRRSAP